MAVIQLFDLARMTVTVGGTGTLTLGTNVTGYLDFNTSGVPTGTTVSYGIVDGTASEMGTAIVTISGGTTTLGSRTLTKSTTGSLLNVSTSAQVFICPRAEDLRQIYLDDGAVGAPSLAFLSDGNSGIYHIGPDHYALGVGGVLAIDISANGIGINGAPGTGEQLRIVPATASSGRILVGDLNTANNYDGYHSQGANDGGTGGITVFSRSDAAGYTSAYANLAYARNNSLGILQSATGWAIQTGNTNRVGGYDSSKDRIRISTAGDITLHPTASITPANNGDLGIETTNNTTLTFRFKGNDGTVRSGAITLS